MATPFRLKRSSVASKRPGLADLQKGELALNFYDGHLFAERDTAGVGIGTTIANLTPWKETFGGAAINYENSVGIGSTNPTGRLDVFGLTVLDEVKVSGFSTFTDTVGITSNFKVSGISSITNTFYFTGITTGREIFFQPSENRIQFKDHAKAVFGTGNKFQIYHDGSSAFVQNFTGNLELQAPANSSIDLNRIANLEEGLNVTSGVSTFATNIDANAGLDVDGLTDLDELKVTGVSTFSGQVGFTTHVDINDHSKLRFGDDQDLEIWHQGSNSIVQNSTGELQLRGNTIRLLNAATTKDYAFFNNNGSVDLYYDDSIKFQTTGIGVSILSGAGLTATIAGPPNLIIDPGTVGDNTGNVRIKGDLYVDGTNFIVDSETITLADHVVGIASTSTTDALTDGAGIGIGTNKFFTFDNSNTAFKSTENLNLESGHTYKIDGTDVLSSTTVGSAVTNSSLTEVGTLGRLNVTGVTTSTGGFRAGVGGTTFTTKGGNVGINTDDANSAYMLEVYGDINIVGTDVDFYENGKRRTAGVGVYSGGTSIAGLGATILDFVGTAVSTVVFDASAGIATINLRKTSFSRDTTSFTANSGQTTYELSYTPGFIDVYVNGVRLTASEFTATNGTSVVLSTGAFTGDIVDITAYVDDGIELGGGKWSPEDGTPANIFYSTGNVGISSANPRVTLDVLGEARISGVVTAGAYLVGDNQVISSARELQNIASLDATTTTTIETAIANAPNTSADLKVSGVSTFIGIATFGSGVGIADSIFHIGDDDTQLRFPAANTFTVETDGDEALRVDSNQRLLVNKTASTTSNGHSILQVASTSNDRAIAVHNFEDDANGPFISLGKSRGTSVNSYTIVQDGDELGNIDFFGADGTDFSTVGARIQAEVDGPVGVNSLPSRLIFATTSEGENNATERLRVSSNGSVGIGITNPESYSSAARALVVGSTSSYSGLTIRSATAGIAYPEGSIYFADGVSGSAGRGRIVYNHGDDSFYVSTSSAERLRINATGVGIGSTAPKGDVDIGEQFSIKTTTTTVSSTAATTVDSLPIATYRSSRFQVQITQGTSYQSADLMVIHDGTTASIIEYGTIATSDYLGTFASTISGSNLLLQVTMGSSSSATIKVVRYGISI